MTPEEYAEKREARYNRLIAAAERAEREANANTNQARDMSSVIPFGQPILVGHHSEGRDRRYRARAEAKMRKGWELHKKAERLRDRAEASSKNRVIFSDDPEAATKIEDRIAKLEQRQEVMRKANALVRANDRDGLLDMGFSETTITQLFTPDFCGRLGFPDYELKNNGANIRRLKARLTDIAQHADDETTETEYSGDVRIVDSVEDGRLQIFFPGKPAAEVRADLKAHGFRWAPSVGAWQRQRNNSAMWHAETIIKKHYGESTSNGEVTA